LTDLIVMALCAVIAGADSWVEVAEWCDEHVAWLRDRLRLEVVVAPAHDPFGRVFSLPASEAVQAALQGWLAAITQVVSGEVVAIDGKHLRHSYDTWHEGPMLQVVNAWATQQHVMLAQAPVEPTSNEIPAVPRLLEQLVLRGCLVTLDALHTHAALAEQLVRQGADYVLPVKDNQPRLATDRASLFAYADDCQFRGIRHTDSRTVEKGHGRIKSVTVGHLMPPTSWPTATPMGDGRTWPRWYGCAAKAASVTRSACRSASSSPRYPPRPPGGWTPFAPIGKSKTSCLGGWMWSLAKTPPLFVPIMPPRTSPSCGAALSP
jgi:predicted transposase YbfD/YdcC